MQAEASAQLTKETVSQTLRTTVENATEDPNRPAYHLTPQAGFMGDPNGGIYVDGWYHIFYLHNPIAGTPGAWVWGHARSRDLLHWEHTEPGFLPAYELGIDSVGSGSTIIGEGGQPIAFYSTMFEGSMKFWRALGSRDLVDWRHEGKNPVLSLDHPGLPRFDKFWRDPFVFRVEERTFLICCADLMDEPYVPVPIFEASDPDLTEWNYKGTLFTYPKHKLRNLEVPDFRPLGNKWLLVASADAPVDHTHGFVGDFDVENLTFTPTSEGPLDYSSHYYAQETILDDKGDLYLLAWIPGWDREGWPNYQEADRKNTATWWNGCFAIPRRLSLSADGKLIQEPIRAIESLRTHPITLGRTELPVPDVGPAYTVLDEVRGNQIEIIAEMGLGTASYCGMNVLCDTNGHGGMHIVWSGDQIIVDTLRVPIPEWKPGTPLDLRVFVDRVYVEVFVNGGKYCITRKVAERNVTGDRVALTRLGGHAVLNTLGAWQLGAIRAE